MCSKDGERKKNRVDPEQTALLEQSYLGQHCFLRPICPRSWMDEGFFFAISHHFQWYFSYIRMMGR